MCFYTNTCAIASFLICSTNTNKSPHLYINCLKITLSLTNTFTDDFFLLLKTHWIINLIYLLNRHFSLELGNWCWFFFFFFFASFNPSIFPFFILHIFFYISYICANETTWDCFSIYVDFFFCKRKEFFILLCIWEKIGERD